MLTVLVTPVPIFPAPSVYSYPITYVPRVLLSKYPEFEKINPLPSTLSAHEAPSSEYPPYPISPLTTDNPTRVITGGVVSGEEAQETLVAALDEPI